MDKKCKFNLRNNVRNRFKQIFKEPLEEVQKNDKNRQFIVIFDSESLGKISQILKMSDILEFGIS